MRLLRSPWTLVATLFIAMTCVICFGPAAGNSVAANSSEFLTDRESTAEDSDSFDEDDKRDDSFESLERTAEEDDGDMEDLDSSEFEDVELHQMEIEANIAHLEMVNRLAEIASNEVAMASYAIMHLEETVDSEEAGIALLKEMIASDQVSPPVKNLLKMKLAELYSWSDQEEAAIDTFKSMLMSR